MITPADWKNLTIAQRTPWVNFHARHVANNPTDPYMVMGTSGRRQVNFLAIGAANITIGTEDERPWPLFPWVQDPFYIHPTDSVMYHSYGWPEPIQDATEIAFVTGFPLRDRYRPPRCYDTGAARRRRNLPDYVPPPWPRI